VVSKNNIIDPANGTALLHLKCSLSTLPLLEHRLTFFTEFTFINSYLTPYYGANTSVDPTKTVSLNLQVSAPLKVDHGPFGTAEITVQPVSSHVHIMSLLSHAYHVIALHFASSLCMRVVPTDMIQYCAGCREMQHKGREDFTRLSARFRS